MEGELLFFSKNSESSRIQRQAGLIQSSTSPVGLQTAHIIQREAPCRIPPQQRAAAATLSACCPSRTRNLLSGMARTGPHGIWPLHDTGNTPAAAAAPPKIVHDGNEAYNTPVLIVHTTQRSHQHPDRAPTPAANHPPCALLDNASAAHRSNPGCTSNSLRQQALC